MLRKSIREARAGELKEFESALQCSLALLELWSPQLEQKPIEVETTTGFESHYFLEALGLQHLPLGLYRLHPHFKNQSLTLIRSFKDGF